MKAATTKGTKARKYYTLVVLDTEGAYIEFGSYDKDDVLDAKAEFSIDGIKTKILVTGDSQEEIDAAFALVSKEK